MATVFGNPQEKIAPTIKKPSNSGRAAGTLTSSVSLNSTQQDRIQQQLKWDMTRFPFSEMRMRLLLLDLAYYMERQAQVNENPNIPRIITALYQDLELPILQPNIDAAHAYLMNIFTSGIPMFSVAAENVADDKQEVARQMDAVIYENSTVTQWKRNFHLVILDALKYNFAVPEVNWCTERTFKPTTDINQNLFQGNTEESWRSGNVVRHWDMYNTFFDCITKPADIVREGDFIGTIKRYTFQQMWQLVANIAAQNGIMMHVQSDIFWKSSPREVKYYLPQVLNSRTVSQGTDWVTFFDAGRMNYMGSIKPEFEVITYYRRIIPKLLGITNVPDANNVQIWKFIEANGYLIYAERMTNAHNMFPALVAQAKEDGLGQQAKGLGEILIPFQNLSSTMWRARIGSLAKGLSDRALYDQSRISEKAVNSPLPTAKIPVRPNAYGKNISEAYYSIPYNDNFGQIVSSELPQVQQFASDAAHINKSMRGQFTKGNRTLQEYMDVMDNSDATQQTMALLLEDQMFMPIKRQILTNILQYQNVGEYYDPNTQQPIEVNPVTLRQATMEFKMADGLMPKDKLLGTEATMQTFQVLAGIEGANQEYDLIGMFAYAMDNRGSKLRQFKRKEQFIPQAPQQREPVPADQGQPSA